MENSIRSTEFKKFSKNISYYSEIHFIKISCCLLFWKDNKKILKSPKKIFPICPWNSKELGAYNPAMENLTSLWTYMITLYLQLDSWGWKPSHGSFYLFSETSHLNDMLNTVQQVAATGFWAALRLFPIFLF